MNQTGEATFTLMADEDIPAGHVATLALNYTGDNGLSGVKYIELTFPIIATQQPTAHLEMVLQDFHC
jgi:hypothetical protein